MTRFTRPDNWPNEPPHQWSNEWPNEWPNEWQDLLAGYALGDLDSEEILALQELLAEQPELMAEAHRLQETLALMPYALPDQNPPPHLRATILAAAAAEPALQPAVQSAALQPAELEPEFRPEPEPRPEFRQGTAAAGSARSHRWTRGWLGWAGAVAAVALLGLGLDNLRLRQQMAANQTGREQAVQQVAELQQELASREAIVAALQSPDARFYGLEGSGSQATGAIVLNRRQNQVVVLAQNLPQLPDGQVYRLWAMPQNSQQPAYCGQFNSSGGEVSRLWQLPKPICSANPAQLLVTTESATASPVPQGELVMKSRG